MDKLQFLTLVEEFRKNLDTELTIQELKEALNHMNTGKGPGSDGLPIEICKRFSDNILPHLLEIYNKT